MQQKSVLIIDDDQDIVSAIEAILSVSGYLVYHAYTAAEGLAMAKTKKLGLILLDLMLPDMHGKEAAEQLRKVDSTKHTPIVVISAARDAKDIAEKMPVQDCIEKPFELKTLLNTVATYIKGPAVSS